MFRSSKVYIGLEKFVLENMASVSVTGRRNALVPSVRAVFGCVCVPFCNCFIATVDGAC